MFCCKLSALSPFQPIMDYVEPILSVASQIYTLVENVKANKKRCCRVVERVKALENLVKSIKQRDAVKLSAEVENSLQGLSITLRSAQELIEKYTLSNLVKRILKSSSHGDEFNSVNERLNDAFQTLALALQLEHGNQVYMVFEQISRQKEDEADSREDDAELKRMLMEYGEYVETIQRELEDIKSNVVKIVEMLNKPRITTMDIRMIKPDELKNVEEKPFMTTPTSEVYKGEFGGFTVAIKKYTGASPGTVKSVFNKEVDTMKRFESPNILRMFGICIQEENTSNPEFLVIMEYCEKGSLRDVLNSKHELLWARKASMCLDAAQGLYRLHLTEEISKLHMSITSSKFLVDENYRVKLGGLELAKTETSLKRTTKSKEKDKTLSSLCYSSPQQLSNINHPYTKECEIYSLGIVLWEIATRKKPFEDCGGDDKIISKKVLEEKYQEPLPADCPDSLGKMINACRAYESSHRPSAGVLVDKLRSVLVQFEKQ
ncbi:mixed lineage kinase domain-like protein isoform X1 [Poeciliopsis prolifica]|uniref:mixed lineage kinase domain-like protein isoform X1 n=2 Tax=Poeciliopsis prolifica TaxID=188132 RepID=UPI0024134F19|nr:mixed lineage kinase domain-like protein isoform X1 [Poeciliopsis prolifica]